MGASGGSGHQRNQEQRDVLEFASYITSREVGGVTAEGATPSKGTTSPGDGTVADKEKKLRNLKKVAKRLHSQNFYTTGNL